MNVRAKRLCSKPGALVFLCSIVGQQSSVSCRRDSRPWARPLPPIPAIITRASLENKSTLLSGGCHLTFAVAPGVINTMVGGE